MSQTPYAVLLCKPSDPDEVVRRLYHAIARNCHPDMVGAGPAARERWHAATEAYNAIKTEEARKALEKRQSLLSGLCAACKGAGTAGTRMFKGTIRLCENCKGEGRC